jgi:proteic killer suppression protein
MHVSFASRWLQELCESEAALVKALGPVCARKAMSRLSDLRAAPTLEDMKSLPGRCHGLAEGDGGGLKIDLTDGRGLILEPTDRTGMADRDSADDWAAIDAVKVIAITNHHG